MINVFRGSDEQSLVGIGVLEASWFFIWFYCCYLDSLFCRDWCVRNKLFLYLVLLHLLYYLNKKIPAT